MPKRATEKMDVSQWLRSLGLSQYEQAFHDNEVDAGVLGKLTADDLKEIGVGPVGHRRKMLDAIALLDQEAARRDPKPEPQPSFAERRHLTVMFVDLVGSTQLSTRLDPEDMRNVVLNYQKHVAAEIERVEGNVAKYMGDGVLAYFGWPKAHENEAERAVRAGLAISGAVSALKDPMGSPLSARVGIATGLVVVGDLIGRGSSQEETVVGDTPNLAARLQSFAAPNQVVVSETTNSLVAGMFESRDLGSPALKGIAQAQKAFEIVRERSLESRFAARAAGGLTRLIGRETELKMLTDKWRACSSGNTQMLIITGEAGIGKSRLVEAVVEAARSDDHLLMRFQCAPQFTGSPLYPVLKQLGNASGMATADSASLRLHKLEVALSDSNAESRILIAAALGLVPNDHPSLQALSPQQLRNRTMLALSGNIVRQAAGKPLLIIFEDAHWVDPSTLEFMSLCLDMHASGLLLLVTARPGFKHNLLSHPHASTVTLNRLERADIGAMAKQVGGSIGLSTDVIDEIIARSDGVPLFIEEMTRAATASINHMPGQASRAIIPPTLQDSLMSRLDRLPSGKETAQVASVIGRSFDYETLSSVSPRSGAELEKDLEALGSEELIFRQGLIPDASYLFKHALVRDAAYESLLKARRQALHARLLSTLESADNKAFDVLAFHAQSASLTDKAIEYWRMAGDMAMSRPAYHEAVSHYANAASLAGEQSGKPELELELRTALGLASIAAKGHSHPDTAAIFQKSLSRNEKVRRPDLSFVTWYGLWCGHHVSSKISLARESAGHLHAAGETVGTSSHRMMGTRALAITALMSGDCVESLKHHQTALQFRDVARDREFVKVTGQDQSVSFNSYYALNLWVLGRDEQAWETAAESISLAKATGHVNSLGYAYMHATLLALISNRPERFSLINEMKEFTSEHRMELWHDFARQFEAITRLAYSQPETVADLKTARGALSARNAGLFSSTLALKAADQLAAQNMLDVATEFTEEAASIISETSERFSEPDLLRMRGVLQIRMGRRNEGREFLLQAQSLAAERQALAWQKAANSALETFK
ncbi:MAG: adenylate/guanylate cyclase domain-containing protein [Micropepsaceae bacterium]